MTKTSKKPRKSKMLSLGDSFGDFTDRRAGNVVRRFGFRRGI
jgi:hypothetical protein